MNIIKLGENLVAYLIASGWAPPRAQPKGLEWRERGGSPPSWYLVDLNTDEILAWINKKSWTGVTFAYGNRAFVSLEGAKRAVEAAVENRQ